MYNNNKKMLECTKYEKMEQTHNGKRGGKNQRV